MRDAPFVVHRPDGFVGVEVAVDDQLAPADARRLAAELLRLADQADRTASRYWVRNICRVEFDDPAATYAFYVQRNSGCRTRVLPTRDRAWPNAMQLAALFRKHKITHVDQTFGDDEFTPESPKKGIHTTYAYLKWWRIEEQEE